MIDVKSAHKSFDTQAVLRGASFTVAQGENLALIGVSGSGKSVILKCALGLLALDRGEIIINRSPDAPHADIGMLFQEAALFDSLPVWRNICFRLISGPQRRTERDGRRIARQKLDRVGLPAAIADKYPSELSGGMRKRVGLARAIASDPAILFFDEPTTGLDPIRAGHINRLIKSIVAESGATAITVTHDMESVHAVADRVALLHRGVIEWCGPIADLAATDNPCVAQFIGGHVDGPMVADG